MALGGAILAGGGSTRMGEPKHAVRLAHGRTMLECVAGSLRRVCEVLAVVGLRDPQHALDVRRQFPNAVIVHDARSGPGMGPLAGIESLLATNLCDAYIICACDTPLLSPEVMEALAAPCEAPTAVLHVEGEESWRPLPCWVSAQALPRATQLLNDGKRAVQELHNAAGPHVIHARASWAEALMDVNTPSDLDSANAMLASKQPRQPRNAPEIVTFPQRTQSERRPP